MTPPERQAAIERLPAMTDIRPVSSAQIGEWRGRLPDLLLDVWQMRGLGTRFGGRSRLCLPGEYAQVVSLMMAERAYQTEDLKIVSAVDNLSIHADA